MLIRRLALSLALVAAVALGVTLDAQFGLPKLPKIPKAPKVPSAPRKDPCQTITDDVLDRALKAMKEKKEGCEKERAAAKADPKANAARASTVLGKLGAKEMPSSADTAVPEPDCSKSDKKAAEDNGFTSEEFTKLQECIPARLYTPSTTAMPDDSAKAIDARRDELKEAFPPQ